MWVLRIFWRMVFICLFRNGTLLMNPSILTSNLQIDGFKHDFILMISSALSRRVGTLQISIIIINAWLIGLGGGGGARGTRDSSEKNLMQSSKFQIGSFENYFKQSAMLDWLGLLGGGVGGCMRDVSAEIWSSLQNCRKVALKMISY